MAGQTISRYSRRNFLRKTALGAVAVGVAAAVPSLVVARSLSSDQETPEASALTPALAPSDPMVAYVKDAAKGEVVFMVGTREVRRRDPRLVSRFMEAMRSARA